MEYDYKAIGDRIRNLRTEKVGSQEKLIAMLSDKAPIGRNTLSAIENGNAKHFELSLLTGLCEIFGCEVGYLLCEYDCKTRVSSDVQTITGLSESAIGTLQNLNDNEKTFLNKLLEHRTDLYFIASGFVDFFKKRSLNKAIDKGYIKDDFSPDTLCIKNDIDYTRFTLNNRFMIFADKATE